MQIVKRIVKWQKDRKLDEQPYEWSNEATNVFEEQLEGLGYQIPKEKRAEIKEDFIIFVREIIKKYNLKYEEPTREWICDSCCDQITFNIGAILKLGFKPSCALDEMLKEIETRKGRIVEGKFQKDTSPEAKASWYIADYSKCKR